jgi:murein DD-endopeptidase MepM/ murein hydrolase activator NlpD
MFKRNANFTLIISLVFFSFLVSAQTVTPFPGPVYVVQEGDTLWDIAAKFNVTVDEIVTVNNLTNQDIYPGNQLIIPGMEELSGRLITTTVPYGETFRSLSRQYRTDQSLLRKLNHIISPTELYAGYELVVLQQETQADWKGRATLGHGETMLELAALEDTDPWSLSLYNNLPGPFCGLPEDVFYSPSGDSNAILSGLPDTFISVIVDPLPIKQGTTVQITVMTSEQVALDGLLVDHSLHFFVSENGKQVALQGVYGMLDPGLYPLRIDATLLDNSIQSFEQMVLVKSGNFPNETINGVDPNTIDPNVTVPEDHWLFSLVAPITLDKYWQGMFQLPVDVECVRSGYGNRRSYNGGVLQSFHSGVDFGICSTVHPFDVYAPADGTVVAIQSDAGHETVRGNATIIDHGLGVYSGLYHQAEIFVAVGDHISAGQLIGKIGETGRANGIHLHWDLFVNEVQVDPLIWMDKKFPH